MKTLLFFFLLLSVLEAEYLWYSYFLQENHVGYTKVSYKWQAKEKNYLKKQEKYRKLGQEEREEISCILNADYSVISGYISSKIETEQEILVVSAGGDKILLQSKHKVLSLEGNKIYLEISDFLKGIVSCDRLEYGRIYKSLVLSGNRSGACPARARYLGKETLWVNLSQTECHIFDVTTSEFKNFWAKAQIDIKGNLVGYKLGSFEMLCVPEEYALEANKEYPVIPAPFVLDVEEIERMYLVYSSAPFSIPTTDIQKTKGNQIRLESYTKESIPKNFISSLSKEYTNSSIYIPSSSPLLLEYARKIHGNSSDPMTIIQKIAQWVQENLEKKRTLEGVKLALFLGYSRNLSAIATVSLCRASRIPSRLSSGIMYTPGKFIYTTWPEVFLGKWLPVYDGRIAQGAFFLTILENKAWSIQENLVSFPLSLQKIVKRKETISLDTPSSYLYNKEDRVIDGLLGIRFLRPVDWILLPKNIQSDILVLRSIKGNGPAILLKVFNLPRTLDEILANLSKKIGTEGNMEVLWQQPRSFPQGKAIEVALKSPQQMVYRAFLGERGKKGVAALLIVPINELMQVEKGFQDLIASIDFCQ